MSNQITIRELRKEKESLEDAVKELLTAFNRKTDAPITDINLNITRISSMGEVDTYIYDVNVEVTL